MQVAMQYPINPFFVVGHKKKSGYGVKFAIKGLQRSVKVNFIIFFFFLSCVFGFSFFFVLKFRFLF